MPTRQKNRQKPLATVGAIPQFAGALVGTAAVTGKKIARFGIRSVAKVRRNGLEKRVAELESDIAAMRRELEVVRSRQKNAKPPKKSRGEQAKAKRKTEKPKRAAKPRKRPASKADVETTVAVVVQKPQPLLDKAKTSDGKLDETAGSTELKTEISRLENEMEDLKYPPADSENEYFDN